MISRAAIVSIGTNVTSIIQSAKDVSNMFAFHPDGHTFIASKLDALLCDYMIELEADRNRSKRKGVKKVCYVVITDGEPCA